MTNALTIYTHFNGDLVTKYCKNNYLVSSYVTPSTKLSNNQNDDTSSSVILIDFGLLYSSSFSQNEVSIAESFSEILNGYYEYIKSMALTSDKVLVIGIKSDVMAPSFFDHYLIDGYHYQVDLFSRRVRSFLSDCLKGIYLVYQSYSTLDEKNYKMSVTLGATYDPILFKKVGATIDAFFDTFDISCKAIIFDLDNTLWSGVIGEGFQNTSLGNPKLDDSGFILLRKYVRLAYETGIFTAICSKNDIHILTDELDRSGFGNLLDYFTIVKANWKDKSKNIINISKELNIGLDTCVFVDDNPRELFNVSSKLPQVKVVNAEGGPWNTLNQLVRSNFIKRSILLEDDIKRNKSTRLRIKDELIDKKISTVNNFEHEAEFYESDVSLSTIQMRIEQLSLKTNQFNLTTRRLKWRNIHTLIQTEGFKILVYGGKDKYGDLGTIGYVLYKVSGKSVLVFDWIMSCRAFGLRLEHTALKKISDAHKVENIKIQYDVNDRNRVALHFFESFNEVKIDIIKSEVI